MSYCQIFFAIMLAVISSYAAAMDSYTHSVESTQSDLAGFQQFIGPIPPDLAALHKVLANSPAAAKQGIDVPRLIALHGPRNSGKTLLFNCLLHDIGAIGVIQDGNIFAQRYKALPSEVTMHNLVKEILICALLKKTNLNQPVFFGITNGDLLCSQLNTQEITMFCTLVKRIVAQAQCIINNSGTIFFICESEKSLRNLLLKRFDAPSINITVPLPSQKTQALMWQQMWHKIPLLCAREADFNGIIKRYPTLTYVDINNSIQAIARRLFNKPDIQDVDTMLEQYIEENIAKTPGNVVSDGIYS